MFEETRRGICFPMLTILWLRFLSLPCLDPICEEQARWAWIIYLEYFFGKVDNSQLFFSIVLSIIFLLSTCPFPQNKFYCKVKSYGQMSHVFKNKARPREIFIIIYRCRVSQNIPFLCCFEFFPPNIINCFENSLSNIPMQVVFVSSHQLGVCISVCFQSSLSTTLAYFQYLYFRSWSISFWARFHPLGRDIFQNGWGN